MDASVAAKWLLTAAGESFILPRQTAWWNCRFSTDASKGSRLDLVRTRQHLVKGRSHGPNQPRDDAHSSVFHFGTLALEIISALDLWALALQIATAYGRTFYDSLYVALAFHTNAELVTADERLANALASRFPVRWLGAFHE